MKTEIVPQPESKPSFKPVSILLTFETQAELDAIACVFNHTHICDGILKAGGAVPASHVFTEAGANNGEKLEAITSELVKWCRHH